MIQKTLKTTNGKLLVSIPTQLNEVTLGQMMQLQEKTELTDLDAISILSNVPADDLKNVSNGADFMQFSDAVLGLSNQIKYLYNSDAIPKTITVTYGGKPVTVDVIKNLSVEPAGAFMAARDIIADEIAAHIKQNGDADWQDSFNPSLLACCKVLAHYLYCRVSGKPYSEYAVADFEEVIKQLWVTEALPIAL